MLAGAVVLALASPLFGENLSDLLGASSRAWGGLLYLAAVGSLIGFTAFAYCLNELPASTVSTYAYVNPVVAVVLGALILGEALTPGLLAGGTLIVIAVVLTTLRPRRRQYSK
jgi:drug/metabolite transporter (DMT)-like permease